MIELCKINRILTLATFLNVACNSNATIESQNKKARKEVISMGNVTSVPRKFDEYQSDNTILINKSVIINPISDRNALEQFYLAKNSRNIEIENKKANFGSYYIIIDYGVGTGCFQAVMMDLRDGIVYSVPIECPSCADKEEYIDFRVNSRLLINRFCSGKKTTHYLVWDEEKKLFQKL